MKSSVILENDQIRYETCIRKLSSNYDNKNMFQLLETHARKKENLTQHHFQIIFQIRFGKNLTIKLLKRVNIYKWEYSNISSKEGGGCSLNC